MNLESVLYRLDLLEQLNLEMEERFQKLEGEIERQKHKRAQQKQKSLETLSQVEDFVRSVREPSEVGAIDGAELYAVYLEWCKPAQLQPISKIGFGLKLKRIGISKHKFQGKVVYENFQLKGLDWVDEVVTEHRRIEREKLEERFTDWEERFVKEVKGSDLGAIDAQEIYAVYRIWCKRNNRTPKQPNVLGKHLKRLGILGRRVTGIGVVYESFSWNRAGWIEAAVMEHRRA